jgi:hypothetical protein
MCNRPIFSVLAWEFFGIGEQYFGSFVKNIELKQNINDE